MRSFNTQCRWIAAASCLLAISSVAHAEEGVVRISDAGQRAGVAKVRTAAPQQIRPASWNRSSAGYSQQQVAQWQRQQQLAQQQQYAQQQAMAAGRTMPARTTTQRPTFQQQQMLQQTSHMAQTSYQCNSCAPPTSYSGSGHCGCGTSRCGTESCGSGHCGCSTGFCDSGYDSCDSSCDQCYSNGYKQRLCTLFAKAAPNDGCTCWPKRWWRGQTLNYNARNQKLANHLFGWMVPSGCCGQGCPPFGKYHVTYADDPGYGHPADGQAYGAHGYGMHMSVPLAPNVRQSYNYSWGTPASRITPIGHYSGPGPAESTSCRTW